MAKTLKLALLFTVIPGLALAQTAPVVQTPDWLYIAVIAVTVTMALVGWGISIFNKKAGLENNATALQIEAHARDLLQTALTNLAGRVVMQAGPKINSMVLDIKNPLVQQAVKSLPNLAGEAVKMFPQLNDPSVVAQKIIDKIGVITAANAAVMPVSTPAAVPPAA
jgi:hypothetical protein